MAESIIAWCRYTFNPWMGCMKVSPGCAHCYAETLTKNRMGLRVWGPNSKRQVTSTGYWRQPLRWAQLAAREGKRERVFCGSLCDWAEDHPTAEATRPRLWDLIRATPELDWLLLSKRFDNIGNSLPADWGAGYPHVWLGVSAEDQAHYELRYPTLHAIPAAVHFISYEPALGPLQIDARYLPDWLIYGGESGPKFRMADVNWARSVRDQCARLFIAFFYKQSSAYRTEMGIELDGQIIRQYPTPRLALPEHP
jgi:protein gp37